MFTKVVIYSHIRKAISLPDEGETLTHPRLLAGTPYLNTNNDYTSYSSIGIYSIRLSKAI